MKIGIDIVEISRFSEMEHGDAFLKRVFTPGEIDYFSKKKNCYESMAGFFAAKEAFSKYLGSGMRGFGWKDIEIVHTVLGKPELRFLGEPMEVDLSISHSNLVAVAVVCGKGEPLDGAYAEEIKAYQALLPKRFEAMHKGDCGRVFVLAGSQGMTGAAELCANAAMRSGSGLVTVGTPEKAQPILAAKLTEVMTLPLCEEDSRLVMSQIKEQMEQSDAVAIGPGLGQAEWIFPALQTALRSGKPLVIDADGLNTLAEHIDSLEGEHGTIVLTPHPGEMSRLCGKSVSEIQERRAEIAAEFARRYKVTLLLKGSHTVIASPRGEVHQNPTGNSGMASGGMGDVLTGVIASLLGQGMEGYQAAVLGAFLHGLAGDMAAEELGEFGMLAGDVVKKLPYASKVLQSHNNKEFQ